MGLRRSTVRTFESRPTLPKLQPYRCESAGIIQLNHELTRIDTNGTDFLTQHPNQSPHSESGASSPNLFHSPDIRVHSCPFVVSVCTTPDQCASVVQGRVSGSNRRAPRPFFPTLWPAPVPSSSGSAFASVRNGKPFRYSAKLPALVGKRPVDQGVAATSCLCSTWVMYFLVAAGNAPQKREAIRPPIRANGIRKIGHHCQLTPVR
jgi:hypothetical protein